MDKRSSRLLFTALASIFLAGNRSSCQAPSLDCRAETVIVPLGQCRSFDNPCSRTSSWSRGDQLALGASPPGVSLSTLRGPGSPTRELCVDSTTSPLVNQPIDYTYSLDQQYGLGTLTLSTQAPLTVTAFSDPAGPIDAGQSVFLFPTAAGGTPPYTYVWTPSDTLSPNGAVRNPTATPTSNTTYTVIATDSGDQITSATVLVVVNASLSALANPVVVNPGQQTQLTARLVGGTPPFTVAWTPAATLDHPDLAQPIATPVQTTTYTVVVTDAQGLRIGPASVTVPVNLLVSASATPPSVVPGAPVQLGAAAAGGSPPYTYRWAPPGGLLPDANQPDPTAHPVAPTAYAVTVTDSAGAQASNSVDVGTAVAGGPVACFTLHWLDHNRIQADASCSTGNIVRYDFWEFWLGNPATPPDQTRSTPTLAWFGDAGATVRVQVTDAAGRTNSTTLAAPPAP